MSRRLVRPVLLAGILGVGGCPPAPPPAEDLAPPDLAAAVTPVLRRPSKSGTIAITDDDALVVMSNPDDDSISIFDAVSGDRRARIRTGREPWAVVLHPDCRTSFVSHRIDSTVVKVSDIDTDSPRVSAPVPVGSEPTGLALSPTGAKLFVAEWAESRVSVIDTASMTVVATLRNIRNPRAIAVTNNGDASDADEIVVVPEFYGEPVPGRETRDDGRRGRVRLFSVDNYAPRGEILFQPLTAEQTGFGVGTAPNQLGAVAISGSRIFVPSVSASPQGPPRFDGNVNPVVYVGDLDLHAEVRTAEAGTVNLARRVREALPDGTPERLFLADVRDVDFVPGTGIAYFVSMGADAVQRVRFDASGAIVEFGSAQNTQIDVSGDPATGPCHNPSGIAVSARAPQAFLNCWVSRRMGMLNLSSQRLVLTTESSPPPVGAAEAVQQGKRFFFTGRGRWSRQGWSSCGSCHPDGLSDGITWVFGTGPRQTPSMDGSYSKGPGEQKQRIFNWTAIIDEVHDFESNVRNTSGGLGAITSAPREIDCGDLNLERRVGTDLDGALPAPLETPTSQELQVGQAGLPAGVRCTSDWNLVEAFVRTIRPPRGRRGLDPASVARGAVLFGNDRGGCVKCHGGKGWTISRRFYAPSTMTNLALATRVPFNRPGAWPMSWTFHMTTQIAQQPVAADNTGGTIGPPQLACAIRNVGTFGIPGNEAATSALEVRASATMPAPRAQGRGGYNPPSLYGLQLSAPYLHHGQAQTLEELFSDPRFLAHTRAGSPNFLGSGNVAQDRQDLISFLLSIDADTPEQPVPLGFDEGCSLN